MKKTFSNPEFIKRFDELIAEGQEIWALFLHSTKPERTWLHRSG